MMQERTKDTRCGQRGVYEIECAQRMGGQQVTGDNGLVDTGREIGS